MARGFPQQVPGQPPRQLRTRPLQRRDPVEAMAIGKLPCNRFGRARVLHAIEVLGSGVTIAALLVLALFG